MRFEGKVYRPWMEAESVLIQTTLGCSNNQCTFCTMFDDKRFKVRDIKDIFEDIDAARKIYPHVESIFLVDGNVMAIRTEMLISILDYIKITFPESKNISLYSGFNDFRRKSLSELKEIKSAGLSMAYSGLESGDPIVLEHIQKRMTREHAINTTSLLNIMQPDAIAPMALAVQPGSVLEKEVNRGEFVLPTPLQILEEEKYLLENLEDFDCYYWGDHGNNISPMRGMLPQARKPFLDKINQDIAHNPITKQNVIKTFAW
ncbi:coproporphyrinogen III oxidase [Vibrio crassostreae 9ZC13]|uniref:radical SAM protein n=1 Tax=Vibrio crassostreae TaxID=246167 RepID=UPI0002FFCC30|nr:radical SAM protein [Vibrio crassostreae]OEE99055.1 coproporphyrinogen III oxidase [Vibrio crassostreae 9ZC13]